MRDLRPPSAFALRVSGGRGQRMMNDELQRSSGFVEFLVAGYGLNSCEPEALNVDFLRLTDYLEAGQFIDADSSIWYPVKEDYGIVNAFLNTGVARGCCVYNDGWEMHGHAK